MRVREAWLAFAALTGAGCVGTSQEGSGVAALEGVQVEVMMVPFDQGATLAEGAEAFDAHVATTDSLTELADGRGAFVIGVADGEGIALVPLAMTEEVATAEGVETDLPPANEELACTSDCDEWCTTSLDHCGGDGFALCDCGSDDAGIDDLPAICTSDCAEWCTSTLEYCGEDGWAVCADSCDWAEARPVPASGFAAEWTAPTVVDGVALAIGLSDARAREALGRAQLIGPRVGGTYGRQADQVLLRLLDAAARSGLGADDPTLSCGQRLLNRGYRPTLSTTARDTIRVGICQQNGLEVWPQSIGLSTGGSTGARFVFEHLTPGAGTTASDVTIRWGQAGAAGVAPGRSVTVDAPLDPAVGLPLEVVVPRTGSTTRVRVTLQP